MTSDYNFQKAREAWGDANPPVTPAPRKWVGLTDKEIEDLDMNGNWDGDWDSFDTLGFARAIEAKLKEKNI